jgi:predicted phage-related endonuclease
MERIPKPKHGSKEWLLTRWRDDLGRCVFGASDIPALMNASPYKTRAELFADKLNEPVEQAESAIFRRGNLLEKPLLLAASDQLSVELFTPDTIYRDGRLSVSLDGVSRSLTEPELVVEAKTTTRYSIYDQNDLPTEWCWQGWAQQAVLDCPVWFSVLDRDLKISVVELPRNEAAIDALRLETEVFGEWVDNNTPPLDEINNFSADDIARIWRATPTMVELDATAAQLVIDLEKARATSKEASDAEARIKDALAQMMLNHEIGMFNGQKIISWTQQAGKKALDTARLRADHPELVKQYEKQGNPYRVMRTHREKVKK